MILVGNSSSSWSLRENMICGRSCCRFLVVRREERGLEGVQCRQHRRWALHRCRPRTAALKPTCSPSYMCFLSSETRVTRGFASIRPSTYSLQLRHPALQQLPATVQCQAFPAVTHAGNSWTCAATTRADLRPNPKRSPGCKPCGGWRPASGRR